LACWLLRAGCGPVKSPSWLLLVSTASISGHATSLIFVPARVGGNHVTLLLDTGAVLTTFSSKIVPSTKMNSRITINMASGSVSASRVPVEFTVGEPDMQERRCSFR
jgi:hypothetical protein